MSVCQTLSYANLNFCVWFCALFVLIFLAKKYVIAYNFTLCLSGWMGFQQNRIIASTPNYRAIKLNCVYDFSLSDPKKAINCSKTKPFEASLYSDILMLWCVKMVLNACLPQSTKASKWICPKQTCLYLTRWVFSNMIFPARSKTTFGPSFEQWSSV